MFRKMPFILAAIIAALMIFDPIIPFVFKQFLYSLSLTIKDFIIFVLPFVIFTLLFKTTVNLAKNATKIIGSIIILVCISNFISTSLSHYLGMAVYKMDLSIVNPKNHSALIPLWMSHFPTFIENSEAMFGGIIAGFIAAKFWPSRALKAASTADVLITKMLNKFTYVIPFFVTGFIVKMHSDGMMGMIVKDYASVFTLIFLGQFSYILFVYLFLNRFNYRLFMDNIKNMLPAGISGFCTMSSAASMPLSILGVQTHAKNKDLVRGVIPATVIHLVGDCFAIPILAFAILKSFGMPEPSLGTYFIFTCYFVLAKFSVAAVPGGGILVMLPILAKYLGFDAQMMSLITALYILLDPVVTCANVLGNGAFAKMMDNLSFYMNRKRLEAQQES